MPGLMTFSATRRRTGCSCSARKTVPIPPSPISCSSLYGPMIVPGPSGAGVSTVPAPCDAHARDARVRGRLEQETPGPVEGPEEGLDAIPQARIGPARLLQVGPAINRVVPLQGRDEDLALPHGHGPPRSPTSQCE